MCFWLTGLLIAWSVLPLIGAEQAKKANRITSERLQKGTAALHDDGATRAPRELPTTPAAADLPAEITLLLSDAKQDCRWTLVGHNEKKSPGARKTPPAVQCRPGGLALPAGEQPPGFQVRVYAPRSEGR